MLVSLEWLQDFVDLPKGADPKKLGNELTLKTAEVEAVIDEAEAFEKIVVGHVLELKPHPDADKLRVAKVSVGKEELQIVCGGKNLKEGMYVPVALIGAKVRWHGEGDLVEMKKVKIRGVESNGMICASNEIGLETPESEGPEDICDLSSIKPEIGKPLADLLGKSGVVFEFDNKSLTHRPDLWGHYGIARELAAVSGGKFKEIKVGLKLPDNGEQVKVKVETPELCSRYCGLIIEGVKVGDSPDWLKRRLKATGHGVHNNIVDVTNYVMTELGQPMHAFDKEYIKGGISVRLARKGEKMTTLDEKERELSEEMLLIADDEKPVAVAGVMGGENSGINEGTSTIILEAANFDAANVRRTSVKLGLRTDSVQRFEKSLDPVMAELAIRRAAEIILEICPGAKIAGPVTDVKNFDEKPVVIEMDVEKAASKIGVGISAGEMKKLLESVGFEVEGAASGKAGAAGAEKLKVTVPSWRSTKDVRIEDDLVEEVARLYGYENVPAELPRLPAKVPMENRERFMKHRLREILSLGFGLDEVYNYSFYGKSDIAACLMDQKGHLLLDNYLSEEHTHLRYSLVPGIMKNLREAVKYFDEVGIYEVGRTYRDLGEYFPLEEKRVTGVILRKGKGAAERGFVEAKGVMDEVFRRFRVDVEEAKGIDESVKFAHPGRAVSYLHAGDTIGEVFEAHPVVMKNYELEKWCATFFCINFTKLMKLEVAEKKYAKVPRFPGSEFDVSVFAEDGVEAGKVMEAVRSSAGSLVGSGSDGVELIDVYYPDAGAGEARRSLTFRVRLAAEDRTLKDDEISGALDGVVSALGKMKGVEVRG